MDDHTGRHGTTNRRSVLQFSALAAGAAALPAGASVSADDASVSDDDASDTVRLGTFERGLDGWEADDDETLVRVSDDEYPAAVRTGEHALGVESRDSTSFAIANERRVAAADFAEHPFLALQLLGGVEGDDPDLTVEFRLHGASGDVATSSPRQVSQFRPRRLQWDMRDVPDETLETARRLEIAWGLADESGATESTRNGLVLLDDVRLFESAPIGDRRQRNEKRKRLDRLHGGVVDRTFEEQSPFVERGTLEYADGTEIPYRYVTLRDGVYRHVIDGEAFEIGGGDR